MASRPEKDEMGEQRLDARMGDVAAHLGGVGDNQQKCGKSQT